MANRTVISPVGQTSFMKIWKAEPNMSGTKNIYSTKLLFPKDSDMSWVRTAWESACMEEFGSKNPPGLRPLFSKGNPFDDKGAIMDGDWKYGSMPADKKDTYDAYRGMWVMGFNADEGKQPAIIDENKVEIMNQADFQSGDYARVLCEISAYTSKKFRSPNVSISFVVIQKDRTGERYSGGISKENALAMFEEASGDDLI